MERRKKDNIPLPVLIKRARELKRKQGFFLLLYDVVGSRKFAEIHGYKKLYKPLHEFHKLVNRKFRKYIVVHYIGLGRKLKKFTTVLGDCGGAYFSDVEILKSVVSLAKELLPFKLRWTVAKDGWDKPNLKI